MARVGKLVCQTAIKCNGDVFHELFKKEPHKIAHISPEKIRSCNLHEGALGTVGSIVIWSYVHDGKPRVAKDLIEAIDEENKSITLKVLKGDLLELYSSFRFTIHVDTKGQDNLVTWTLEYEKRHENVEDPNSMMEFVINLTKDIETHHLK